MDATALGLAAWRLYNTDGVPASGPREPPKQEILDYIAALGAELDLDFTNLQNLISVAGPQVARAYPPTLTPIGIRPEVIQAGAGPGRAALSHTPWTYATHRNNTLSSTSSTIWVDDQYGNDGNAGSPSSPVKTLTYASSTSTAQIVRVRPGLYIPPKPTITDASFAGGRSLKQYVLEPGVVIAVAGPRLQDATYTLHSGTVNVDAVYKTTLTLTGAQTVQRVVRRDTYDTVANQPLSFTQHSSLANLLASSASTSGWFIETVSGNKIIYIRLAGGASVITNKSILKAYYVDSNFQSDWNVNGVPVVIQAMIPGTALLDGVGLIGTDASGSLSEVYADGLTSRFALLSAFQCFGGTNYFARCVAHAPVGDCFNYNSSTALAASQNIELDCRGTAAGDIATFGTGVPPNRNGSSVHDFVDIQRYGCWHEGNWGPQYADIANAATGTSLNIGCISGPTTEPQRIGFFSSDAGRKSYWDQCYAYGNTTAISCVTGTGKATNCIFDGAVVGTVGTYNPATGL